MEPEDDNAITIPFTGDTFVSDYITFTNTLNVDGSFLTYTGGGGEWETEVSNYRNNVDDKIVIPYAFEKVLKKSIEGLEDVRVVQYESYQTTFRLNLELKISWDVKQLYTKKDYTDKINILFKTMYPSIPYKFEVKHVIGGEKDKHKEFFEFFSR
jgi:hypothetical protein